MAEILHIWEQARVIRFRATIGVIRSAKKHLGDVYTQNDGVCHLWLRDGVSITFALDTLDLFGETV